MIMIVTSVCLAILIFGAGFHFYWGFGGRVGYEASLPRRADGDRLFDPPWWGGHLVGAGLVVACWLVLAAAHVVSFPLPPTWVSGAVGLMGAGFIARSVWATPYGGFLKSHRGSSFATYDTWLYSPLFLVLGLALLYVAQHS